ncbi:MAG: hypothetical protein ACE5GS_00740 [Kiloniellaceae bacterium]
MDGDRHLTSAEVEPVAPQAGERRDATLQAIYERREWSGDHPVNIRLSVPLLFGRYYVTLVAGKERRSAERLASERRKHPLIKFGNLVVLFALGTVCGLAGLALVQVLGIYVLERAGLMVVN